VADPVVDVAASKPDPALEGLIDNYLGYRYAGLPAGIHRGLPSRRLTFIISLDGPVDMAELPNPEQPSARMSAFVAGLTSAPAIIRHEGTEHGIQIDLTPLGVRHLFGLPAGALANHVVELGDLLGSPSIELVDRLAGAETWVERFAVVDDVLLRQAREVHPPVPEVLHAWNRLVATEGSVEVGALAREIGWSRRHLGERFRDEFGVTPKVMGRMMRFERARELLQLSSRPSLAEVAATCGYYDQAHMNRDWNQFAGCPPAVWMAEELPSVQDALSTAGAS
jgi:AraC-like DNA-binding protein